jgi:hypothetical protein
MKWVVGLDDAFVPEYDELAEDVRDELLALMQTLENFGPSLTRPHADTLNGSRHANMKELRLNANDGVWRFAFAFDPERKAIVFCGGDKSGISEKRFYRRLIAKADSRYSLHLARLKAARLAAEKQEEGKGRKG